MVDQPVAISMIETGRDMFNYNLTALTSLIQYKSTNPIGLTRTISRIMLTVRAISKALQNSDWPGSDWLAITRPVLSTPYNSGCDVTTQRIFSYMTP